MTEHPSFHSRPASLLQKAWGMAIALGKRILVHITGFAVCGTAAASLTGTGFFDTSGVAVSAYIGFICLVPQGMSKSADWLIPTALGIAHCLLWSALGIPWQYVLLWGGAVTWGIRCLMRRGAMHWEWSVVPFLVITAQSSISSMLKSGIAAPYWTLFLFIPAGWLALLLYARLKGDPLQRHMLLDACARLEAIEAVQTLPQTLRNPARQMLEHCLRLKELLPRMEKSTAPLMRRVESTALKLSRAGALSPLGQQELLHGLLTLNSALRDKVQSLEPPKPAPKREEENPRIAVFREQARALADKRYALPLSLQKHLDGICRSASGILDCMRDDPRDLAPGERFLSRYLKAAHTVVDEYAKLLKAGANSRSIESTLARSGELLDRLEQAFADQYRQLLENDTLNLNAELNVLDKLLKMEGR